MSPLGRYQDAITAAITLLVVAAFLVVHGAIVLASLAGIVPAAPIDTSQLDTATIGVLGFLGIGGTLGAVVRSATGSGVSRDSSVAPSKPVTP